MFLVPGDTSVIHRRAQGDQSVLKVELWHRTCRAYVSAFEPYPGSVVIGFNIVHSFQKNYNDNEISKLPNHLVILSSITCISIKNEQKNK